MANYIGQMSMMDTLLKRASREILGIVATGVAMKYGNNPAFIALKPVLSVLGKFLREKYGYTWFPF